MGNSSAAKKCILIGVLLTIGIAIAFYFNITKINNYKNNGKQVQCVTTMVIPGRKGKQTVQGIYYDERNNEITANVIRNAKTYIGEEYIGYILPESPKEVYCMPSDSLRTIGYILFGFFGLAGIGLIITGIICINKNK